MKKIRFKKLKLLNFCGIKTLEVDFGEPITTISASNGKGKSTIARAISYVLFGTDDKGNAFDIKTFDQDHRIIPEIPHEVELTMTVDGDEIALKKTLTDKWNGDKCKNTFRYFIDGEVTTATDYAKTISDIFPSDLFTWLVNPSTFLSAPWKAQRDLLILFVGNVSDISKQATQGDPKYDFILESLSKQTIDKQLHHLRYSRTEVQKQLDQVPIRLAALSKALPEAEDWEGIKIDIANNTKRLDEANSKITSIKTGGAAQVRNEGIHKKMDFQRRRIDEIEKSARIQSSDEAAKHTSDIISARTEQSKAKSMVDELQAKMDGFTDTELHLKQQLEELEAKKKDGAKQYDDASAERWQWDDNDSFCPHCGQPLQPEKILRLKRDSEDRFNERKANRLKQLVVMAGDIKGDISKVQDLLQQLQEDRTTTTNQLAEAHKSLKKADAYLAEVQKKEPRTYAAILADNANYKQAVAEYDKLEDELNSPSQDEIDSIKMLADLQEQARSLQGEIETLRSRLSKKETFDHVTSLIEECKHDKETYQNQLDEIDRKLDITNDYWQKTCHIIEEQVNKHFSYVKWSLFLSNMDGEQKPYCECYHDGVPYSRLNGASKVNAAIDVAYTVSKFYDVSIPMVLDECESNLHPIFSDGQQIRLYVTHDEQLKVEQLPKFASE